VEAAQTAEPSLDVGRSISPSLAPPELGSEDVDLAFEGVLALYQL
jgi:hypothetical protein